MQSIVFAHTARKVRDRVKTVTRRIGWRHLPVGTLLRAIDREPRASLGPPQELAILRALNVRREVLEEITSADVVAEGFPGMTASTFVRMFAQMMGVEPDAIVTRIEFEYLEVAGCPRPEPPKIPTAAPMPAGAPAAPAPPKPKQRVPHVRSTRSARVRASLESGKRKAPPARTARRDHWFEDLDLFGNADPRTPTDD